MGEDEEREREGEGEEEEEEVSEKRGCHGIAWLVRRGRRERGEAENLIKLEK